MSAMESPKFSLTNVAWIQSDDERLSGLLQFGSDDTADTCDNDCVERLMDSPYCCTQ